MGNYFDMIEANLKEVESVQADQVFIWRNAQYVCVKSCSEAGVSIDPRTGNTIEWKQQLFVRKSLFDDGAWPQVGHIVTVYEGVGTRPVDRKVSLIVEEDVYVILHLIDLGK